MTWLRQESLLIAWERGGGGGGGFLGRNKGVHEQIIKGKLQKIDCQLTVNDGGEHYGG